MKFDIITDYYDVLDSEVVSLAEAQSKYPNSYSDLATMLPGQRLRLENYTVAYCILDTETKSFYEL